MESQGVTKSVLRIPGHLTGPIVRDETRFLTQNNTFHCRRHKKLKEEMLSENIIDDIYDKCTSPWRCLMDFLTKRYILTSQSLFKNQLQTALLTAVKTYKIQHNTMYPDQPIGINDRYASDNDLVNLIMNDQLLIHYYELKRKSESLKDLIMLAELQPGELCKLHPYIKVEKEIFLFKCSSHGSSVGPTNLLLGLLDIAQTRFSLLLYWRLVGILKREPRLYQRGVKLINAIEELWPILGENIFKLLKLWDSYVIGCICKDGDNDVGFNGLFDSTVQEILVLYPEFFTSNLAELMYPPMSDDGDIMISLELSTLAKSFGHPFLNEYDGILKLKERACATLDMNPTTIYNVRNMFVKTFIQNFTKDKHQWPNVVMHRGVSEIIVKCYNQGRWLTEAEDLLVPITAWTYVSLGKNFEFDYAVDTSELLSDKSCAPPLSYWTQKYDTCGFKILHNQKKPKLPIQETRVILKYLVSQPNETYDTIQSINAKTPNPENDVVNVTRKERELTPETGRLFCSQTYHQRLAQTACEANIKKTIFKYIPYQTMSDTELGLSKKISSFIRVQMQGGDIINLDLDKWNMFQRAESINPIAKEIDNLFGFQWVYQDSHYWMQRCYVLNNSRVNPPRIGEDGMPELGPGCHINQKGGFEGMRQKLWTIGTIATIQLAAYELGLRTSILGQGDNQVVVITYTPSQLPNKQDLRNQFLTRLNKLFSEEGLKLKLSETWISTRLLEYGKQRWFKGVPVPSGTKRAARIISEEGDGVPTFDVALGMISTATENIASLDTTPTHAFIIYCVEIITLLYRRLIINEKTPLELCIALLFWPNVLGGLTISNLPNHTIRGFDDALTIWLSMYRYIYIHDYPIYMNICKLIPLIFKNRRDYTRLIEDIFSINVPTLQTASLVTRNKVKTLIPTFTTNPEVLTILSLDTSDTEALVEKLMRMEPLYLPLAHELYKNSNAGTIKQLQNKLTNVQSVVKMARKVGEEDLYAIVRNADNRLINIVRVKCQELVEHPSRSKSLKLTHYLQLSSCTYIVAQAIRNDSWGVVPLGVTHAVPWEQFNIVPFEQLEPVFYDKSILIELSQTLQEECHSALKLHGPYPVYHGSITHVKAHSTKVDFMLTHPFIDSLKRLVYYKSWAQKMDSTSIDILINDLIKSKMSLLPQNFNINLLLDQTQDIYSGHLFHRMHASTESRGSLANVRSCVPTHIRITTSTLKGITHTGKDYNIFYQNIFLYIISCFSDTVHHEIMSDNMPLLNPEYRAYLRCSFCTHELPDTKIQIKDPLPNTFQKQPVEKAINLPKEIINPRNIEPILPHGVSSKTLYISESLKVGSEIAADIRCAQYSAYADRNLLGLVESTDINFITNIADLRKANLYYVLIGVIYHSRLLRISILSKQAALKTSSPDYLCQPMARLLISSGRIIEFLHICHIINKSPNLMSDITVAAGVVWKGLENFFARYRSIIIHFAMVYNLRKDVDTVVDEHLYQIIKISIRGLIDQLKVASSIQSQDFNRVIKEQENEYQIRTLGLLIPLDESLLLHNALRNYNIFKQVYVRNTIFAQASTDKKENQYFSLWDRRKLNKTEYCGSPTTNIRVITCSTTCNDCKNMHSQLLLYHPRLTSTKFENTIAELCYRFPISYCPNHPITHVCYFVTGDHCKWHDLISHLYSSLPISLINRYKRVTPKFNKERMSAIKNEIEAIKYRQEVIKNDISGLHAALNTLKSGSVNRLLFSIRKLSKIQTYKELILGNDKAKSQFIIDYESAHNYWRSHMLESIVSPSNEWLHPIPTNLTNASGDLAEAVYHSGVCTPRYPALLLIDSMRPHTHSIDIATVPNAQLSTTLSIRSGDKCNHQINDDVVYKVIYNYHHFSSHLCKITGEINSSPNALVPIITSLDEEWVPTHVFNLAGGSGSNLLTLAHFFPDSYLYFNTLTTLDKHPKIDRAVSYPEACVSDPCINLDSIMERSYPLLNGITDILDRSFLEKLLKVIRLDNVSNPRILIVIDIESPKISTFQRLAQFILQLCNLLSTDKYEFVVITNYCFSRGGFDDPISYLAEYENRIISCRSDPQMTSYCKLLLTNYDEIFKGINSLTLKEVIQTLNEGISCDICINGTFHIAFANLSLRQPPKLSSDYVPSIKTALSSAILWKDNITNHLKFRNITCLYREVGKSQFHNPSMCSYIVYIVDDLLNLTWESLRTMNPAITTMTTVLGKAPKIIKLIEEVVIIHIFLFYLRTENLEIRYYMLYRYLTEVSVHYTTSWEIQDNEINDLEIKLEHSSFSLTLIKKHKSLIRDLTLCLVYGRKMCKSTLQFTDHLALHNKDKVLTLVDIGRCSNGGIHKFLEESDVPPNYTFDYINTVIGRIRRRTMFYKMLTSVIKKYVDIVDSELSPDIRRELFKEE